jgi:hypothetical protein
VRFYAKAAAAWLVILAAMAANGLLRGLVLQPHLGEHHARQVSSILGACLVVTLAGVFVRRLPDPARSPLLGVGLLWGLLTVAFEFGFGHYVSGLPWSALLADYDVAAGRLWPLVLLATLLAPGFWGLAVRGAASAPSRAPTPAAGA